MIQRPGVLSPLASDGWIEFNRAKWGVRSERICLSPSGREVPRIELIVYTDKRGRVYQPPVNAYLPARFVPSETTKPTRLARQWQVVSTLLADEMARRGLRGSVALHPSVQDVRAWYWRGFSIETRYTYILPLPFNEEIADYAVRKQIRKASSKGFECGIGSIEDFRDAIECVSDSEHRGGFSYRINVQDLTDAVECMGSECCRVYVCKDKEGRVVSMRTVLFSEGAEAVDWLAGTRSDSLHSGATQLLIRSVLGDLGSIGAHSFNFAGANLPAVSSAKADWGGRLARYPLLRAPGLGTVKQTMREWLRFRTTGQGKT